MSLEAEIRALLGEHPAGLTSARLTERMVEAGAARDQVADALRILLARREICAGGMRDGYVVYRYVAPAPEAPAGLASITECCRCGKRVRITVGGRYSHHKPRPNAELAGRLKTGATLENRDAK